MTKQSTPHADLIRAVLDGKTVQYESAIESGYVDLCPGDPLAAIRRLLTILWATYRIKPEPLVKYLVVSKSHTYGLSILGYDSLELAQSVAATLPSGQVSRLELDPDTLAVISATTEAA